MYMELRTKWMTVTVSILTQVSFTLLRYITFVLWLTRQWVYLVTESDCVRVYLSEADKVYTNLHVKMRSDFGHIADLGQSRIEKPSAPCSKTLLDIDLPDISTCSVAFTVEIHAHLVIRNQLHHSKTCFERPRKLTTEIGCEFRWPFKGNGKHRLDSKDKLLTESGNKRQTVVQIWCLSMKAVLTTVSPIALACWRYIKLNAVSYT